MMQQRGSAKTPSRPGHLRRARLAKRAQLLLALAAAVFALYRLSALFLHPGASLR
jgi:hypothetical protein